MYGRVLKTIKKGSNGHYVGNDKAAVFAIADIQKLLDDIAKLKAESADNADALLAAYQQGRADERKNACHTK